MATQRNPVSKNKQKKQTENGSTWVKINKQDIERNYYKEGIGLLLLLWVLCAPWWGRYTHKTSSLEYSSVLSWASQHTCLWYSDMNAIIIRNGHNLISTEADTQKPKIGQHFLMLCRMIESYQVLLALVIFSQEQISKSCNRHRTYPTPLEWRPGRRQSSPREKLSPLVLALHMIRDPNDFIFFGHEGLRQWELAHPLESQPIIGSQLI